MGLRPAGSSRSVDVSRSPNTVIATVRGIGVAVMTRTCGLTSERSTSAERCSTPNRCCSSTTSSPRSANSTCSWISAWVPTTMPASPDAASSSASLRALAPSEPVSSWTRVASVGSAEHAALREVAQQSGDGAMVLGGEHLGGSEQRGLAAGVDDLEHREQGDDGLARPDLALQQPVHGVGAREIGADDVGDLLLAVGEDERQTLGEPLAQAAGDGGTRRGRIALERVPTLREHRLQHERLLEAEPVARPLPLLLRARAMDLLERLGARRAARAASRTSSGSGSSSRSTTVEAHARPHFSMPHVGSFAVAG